MKTCKTCLTEQPDTAYAIDRSYKCGKNANCRTCIRARNAQRYLEQRDRILAANANWRAANPHFREAWAAANRERVLACQKRRVRGYSPSYVRGIMIRVGFLPEHITPQLMAAYEQTMRLRRYLKEQA